MEGPDSPDEPTLQPADSELREAISPLSRVPLDIAHHRQLLFALESPVQFDQKAWDKYWP
jgi:hypothetical protein